MSIIMTKSTEYTACAETQTAHNSLSEVILDLNPFFSPLAFFPAGYAHLSALRHATQLNPKP
jgi:hypothetical protein